jgi:hypothetical protein
MTSEVARDSPIGRRIAASGVELRSKHSYLAAYLLEERAKGARSFWHPYIDILPRHFDSVPIFFDEPTLALLVSAAANDSIDAHTYACMHAHSHMPFSPLTSFLRTNFSTHRRDRSRCKRLRSALTRCARNTNTCERRCRSSQNTGTCASRSLLSLITRLRCC